MTHSGGKPHTNIGDRGQRYETRSTGWPKAEKTVVGWSPNPDGGIFIAMKHAPGCTEIEIFDRQENIVHSAWRKVDGEWKEGTFH